MGRKHGPSDSDAGSKPRDLSALRRAIDDADDELLRLLNERARLLDGRLKIESSPGQGTRLEVTVPLEDSP